MNRASSRFNAYLVGGGIASLAAAVYLMRDGHVPGKNIHVLEEKKLRGSLDAIGSPQEGFSMRGTQMYGAAYVVMCELLSGIPSLDDPATSVTQDTLEFWQEAPWDDRARLVEGGQIVDVTSFGLSNKDRVDLIELMLRDEDVLGSKRIRNLT